MLAPGRLTELDERKRLLLLEAELHRVVLQAEAANLRGRFSWLGRTSKKASPANTWLSIGAAVAGLLAATRWRKAVRWIPIALTAWRWWRRFKSER